MKFIFLSVASLLFASAAFSQMQVVPDKVEYLRSLSQKEGIEDSFHVVDLGVLPNRLSLWKQHLHRVQPFYAVKANNDPSIISVLASLGVGFDCASKGELNQILNEGVEPSRVIFAHPRKPISEIGYARDNGVLRSTFESLEELEKLRQVHPKGEYILRIATDDSHSTFHLSSKFGATMQEAFELLDYAFINKLNVIGISFHVGSDCTDPESYSKALDSAAKLFRYSSLVWAKELMLLDIGGGFPGDNDDLFISVAQHISSILEAEFDSNVTVIAEPGRYFAAKTTAAAMKIVGKKVFQRGEEEKRISYYLTNGAYGFFLDSMLFNHCTEKLKADWRNFYPLSQPLNSQACIAVVYPSTLWGPTCDSLDKILDVHYLPEMNTGDFIYCDCAGAYTNCLKTQFNGITPSKAYYIDGVK